MLMNRCLRNIIIGSNKIKQQQQQLLKTTTSTRLNEINIKQQPQEYKRNFFTKIEQNELGVRYRFGKISKKVLGPGLALMVPYIHNVDIFDTRLFTQHLPEQTLVTLDNVVLSINCMISYRVVDPLKLVSSVTSHDVSIKDLLQIKLIELVPKKTLVEIIHDRSTCNQDLLSAVKETIEEWGVIVDSINIKDVVFTQEISDAMGKKAEAQFLKEARLIIADSELSTSKKIVEAANELQKSPMGMRLREIEALEKISSDPSKSFIFVPSSIFDSFSNLLNNKK